MYKSQRNRRSHALLKESLPTMQDGVDTSFSGTDSFRPRLQRHQSAHIKFHTSLNFTLESRVKPEMFEGVMRVGNIDSGKLLLYNSDDGIACESEFEDIDDEKSVSQSSVAQLKLEDGMDRRERQWNCCVNILQVFQGAIRDRKGIFVDIY